MRSMFRQFRQWNLSVTTLLVASLGIAAIGGLQLPQLQQLKTKSQTASIEQMRRDITAEQARLRLLAQTPTFGYDNLLANWVFLNFLQYYGDTPVRQKTDYRLSPDFFEIILNLDPYFIQAYTFLSTSSSLYAAMPERSIDLTLRYLPFLKPNVPRRSYFVWRQLGIDQLLFTGDSQAARQSFVTAADWARQDGSPEALRTAELSATTADFLARDPDSKRAQLAAWVMVLTTVPDDRTRQTAIQRIEALGGRIINHPDGSFQISAPSVD